MKKEKTPWDKKVEKSSANIGYLSRLGSFHEPSPAEKAAALAIETQSWQATKGKKTFRIGAEYSTPIYKEGQYGVNLKSNRERGGPIKGFDQKWFIAGNAETAYIKTPMDHLGVLKKQGIDVSKWEKPPNIFMKIYDWFKVRVMGDLEYERPPRLTEEFVKAFGVSLKNKDQKCE